MSSEVQLTRQNGKDGRTSSQNERPLATRVPYNSQVQAEMEKKQQTTLETNPLSEQATQPSLRPPNTDVPVSKPKVVQPAPESAEAQKKLQNSHLFQKMIQN